MKNHVILSLLMLALTTSHVDGATTQPDEDRYTNSLGMTMVRIAPGLFVM